MPRRSRTHLPFLSLFRSRVMMDILTHITQESVYRSVMGEQLGWGACRSLLRAARNGGFLEPVTPSVYQIHPAMAWFYGRALYRQLPPARVAQLEAEFVRGLRRHRRLLYGKPCTKNQDFRRHRHPGRGGQPDAGPGAVNGSAAVGQRAAYHAAAGAGLPDAETPPGIAPSAPPIAGVRRGIGGPTPNPTGPSNYGYIC